jgi:prepilin peptidase CpaA
VFAFYLTLVVVWVAAWVDVRTRRIPNTLSLAAAGMGLLLFLASRGLPGLVQGLAGLGLGLALMLPGYLLRSTGAGDVKLMAAVGALLGPGGVLAAFALSYLAGAVTGLGLILVAAWTQGAPSPIKRYAGMLRFLVTTGRFSYVPPAPGEAMAQRFPFAVSIAIGTTLAALWMHP